MLYKLNKIKWSQIPTLAIETDNKLLCNDFKI